MWFHDKSWWIVRMLGRWTGQTVVLELENIQKLQDHKCPWWGLHWCLMASSWEITGLDLWMGWNYQIMGLMIYYLLFIIVLSNSLFLHDWMTLVFKESYSTYQVPIELNWYLLGLEILRKIISCLLQFKMQNYYFFRIIFHYFVLIYSAINCLAYNEVYFLTINYVGTSY